MPGRRGSSRCLTALMGFVGHTAAGDLNASWAVPLAMVAAGGGLIGGRFSLGTKPGTLKKVFAYTNLAAAALMAANALTTHTS